LYKNRTQLLIGVVNEQPGGRDLAPNSAKPPSRSKIRSTDDRSSKMTSANDQTSRGQQVFEREQCATCHPPPLYTNNKLTVAVGFRPRSEDLKRLDIMDVTVGSDPALTLRTRRGTGFYKVPSLKGLWYRGPFEHSGSVATLEDWFDRNRLRDDYVPKGFEGVGVKARPVRGHEFGLKLSSEDKAALIAFLKTL
jgi:hypothetical protein